MVTVGVIGSGAWGTTLATIMAQKKLAVTLWEHRAERAEEMEQKRENVRFLAGITLPEGLRVTSSLEEAVRGKDCLILVTPSQRLRENLRLLREYLDPATLLVSASKGIEVNTLKRMSEIICDELPDAHDRLAVLSGPNLSREVAENKPTAAVVAGYNKAVAIKLRDILTTAWFRVYNSDDVIGTELAGALKNIIAIGAGFNDGMDFGENAKAAFITRGVAEIARLGVAAGANPMTFAGLAGIGDLIATCASPLSRNQQVGRRLAAGETLDQILGSMNSVAEGVYTTKGALQLAAHYGVDLPITQQLSQVLFEGMDPRRAVVELMMRDSKHELDGMPIF